MNQPTDPIWPDRLARICLRFDQTAPPKYAKWPMVALARRNHGVMTDPPDSPRAGWSLPR
jgi:hypothetical protein